MSSFDTRYEIRPSLFGTMSAIGGTAVGAPIDTIGYKDCIAFVTAGGVQGSNGSTVYLDLKIQESASLAGTGSSWTDITNGGVHSGSWDFDQISFAATTGTHINMQTAQEPEKIGDGVRQRYIRFHATLSGTIGTGPKVCANFLLARNYDSSNVATAVTQATNNSQFTNLY